MTSRPSIDELELPLRVTLVGPPSGVVFCVQGKDAADRISVTRSTGEDVSFDLSVRVKPGGTKAAGPPRFLGPFTHGPPDGRFVYVCSGTSAGDTESCWTRRAKIHLSGITRELIDQVRTGSATRLEARIPGTARDGGPSCATVPLLDGGWKPVRK